MTCISKKGDIVDDEQKIWYNTVKKYEGGKGSNRMGIKERISQAYGNMSKNEKKIADYCLSQPEEFKDLSVQELGERTQTSPSAIIRFIKKLNYSRLSDMRFDIMSLQTGKTENLQLPVSENDSCKSVCRIVSDMLISELKVQLSLLNYKQLEKIIPILRRAKRYYLFGLGTSGIAADSLEEKLIRIGKTVIFSASPHLQLINSLNATPEDVAIFFSYSGKTPEILLCAEQTKMQKVTSIAITCNTSSKLSKLTDFTIPLPNIKSESSEIRLGAIISGQLMAFLSSVLYICIAQDNFEQTKQRLIQTKQIIEQTKAGK